MIKWVLKKLISRERDKQVNLYGYDAAHDDAELEKNPYHLLEEAWAHYNWGHHIQALALLQAQTDYSERIYVRWFLTRLSEDK